MRRLIALLGLSLCLCVSAGTVQAEPEVMAPGTAVALAPEPALGNNPVGAYTLGKAIVEYLQPSYETVWDMKNGTWSQGVSGSLYNLKSNQIYLASLRLGYSTDQALYTGIKLDLPGLAQRFIPATVAGIATTQPLDTLWSLVGKYASVGVVGGYSWAQDEMMYGVSLGASVKF